MRYEAFTDDLRRLFLMLTPNYVGTAHSMAGDKIKIKSDDTPVGDLDNYSLAHIRELVSKYFPDDFTIGEEDGMDEEEMRRILQRDGQYQWTIDGLDGTGNRRIGTTYGASVSRRSADEVWYAAIFRPIDELIYQNGFYCAERGKGAWQWCEACGLWHQLYTAAPGALERRLVLLEGSSKKFFVPPITDLGKVITTRPSVSSSVAATIVASGKASALVTVENKPWDNWPSILFIEEAGGVVTDWHGNPWFPGKCGNIVAAANEVDHKVIVELLNKVE